MNVYSIRFFPKLKIKFCQYFGIANALAVEELDRRAEKIENRLSQLHRFLKLQAKRQRLEQKKAEAKVKRKVTAPKSTPVLKKKSKAKKPVLAKVTELPISKRRPALVEKPIETPKVPVPALIEERVEVAPPVVQKAPEEVVILIQPEDETRRAVQGYFGSDVTLIELENLQHLENQFVGKNVLAVIFDRFLLSQEQAQPVFETLSQQFPQTKMIGLSHYLTLALAESIPHRNDFATFTARPLSSDSLSQIFGGKVKQAGG